MRIGKLTGPAAAFCAMLAAGIAPVALATPAAAQVALDISVNIAPPPLPVYEQPPLPDDGYIWTPGYWAWDVDIEDYYWVPGAWAAPPRQGLLWTPGYWGWGDGVYLFHPGYWGRRIGFYGGVDYGYGYDGVGYSGGEWRDNQFFYNRSVSNVANVGVTNVYDRTVVINRNAPRTSFNGGPSGLVARPTPQQALAEKVPHIQPTGPQTQQFVAARAAPDARFKQNRGKPATVVTARPVGVSHAPAASSTPVAAKPVAAKPVAAKPEAGGRDLPNPNPSVAEPEGGASGHDAGKPRDAKAPTPDAGPHHVAKTQDVKTQDVKTQDAKTTPTALLAPTGEKPRHRATAKVPAGAAGTGAPAVKAPETAQPETTRPAHEHAHATPQERVEQPLRTGSPHVAPHVAPTEPRPVMQAPPRPVMQAPPRPAPAPAPHPAVVAAPHPAAMAAPRPAPPSQPHVAPPPGPHPGGQPHCQGPQCPH